MSLSFQEECAKALRDIHDNAIIYRIGKQFAEGMISGLQNNPSPDSTEEIKRCHDDNEFLQHLCANLGNTIVNLRERVSEHTTLEKIMEEHRPKPEGEENESD